MKDKSKYIDEIAQELSVLSSKKIHGVRQQEITDMIRAAVNGDEIAAHLVTDVTLKEDRPGISIFILTNKRLIQLDIEMVNENVSGMLTFALSDMDGIDLKSNIPGVKEAMIDFKTHVVGLKYPTEESNVTKFFEVIEQVWNARM